MIRSTSAIDGAGDAGAFVDFEPPCGSSVSAYTLRLEALPKISASARKRLVIISLNFFMRILLSAAGKRR
jgi:hypothetical protein